MAVASIGPIQIGRYRSPPLSLSSTMGWFVGISTRTPTTSISFTATPSSTGPHVSVVPCACGQHSLVNVHPLPPYPDTCSGRFWLSRRAICSGVSRALVLDTGPWHAVPRGPPGSPPGLVPAAVIVGRATEACLGKRGVDQDVVQPQEQGRDLARGMPGCVLSLRAALAQGRCHELLDQRDVPIGRGPGRPQVPGLHSVPGKPGDSSCDIQRVLAVQPADPPDEPVRLEFGKLLLIDAYRVEQVAPTDHFGPACEGRVTRLGLGWLGGITMVEPFPDHAKREVLVTLRSEDEPELINVRRAEPTVSRGRACGGDQALGLEEADLR